MNATAIRGVVRNGKVEVNLPDGTEVDISPRDDDAPLPPEEIARILAAMEKIEPFELTPEEEAEWQAERQRRKEDEKARFVENAEKLKRMWE